MLKKYSVVLMTAVFFLSSCASSVQRRPSSVLSAVDSDVMELLLELQSKRIQDLAQLVADQETLQGLKRDLSAAQVDHKTGQVKVMWSFPWFAGSIGAAAAGRYFTEAEKRVVEQAVREGATEVELIAPPGGALKIVAVVLAVIGTYQLSKGSSIVLESVQDQKNLLRKIDALEKSLAERRQSLLRQADDINQRLQALRGSSQ